jgi:hypothetical protein
MYFDKYIFQHILSFIPKYLKIDPLTKNTELHNLIMKTDCNISTNKIKKMLSIYSLYENNYLQNNYGHTPLHVAYQYSNYKIIKLLEKKYPNMMYIRQIDGELPRDQKDAYIKFRRSREE